MFSDIDTIYKYKYARKAGIYMPVEKGSKKRESQRQAENRYKKENIKTAACNVPIAKYERFKAYAASQGKTVSGLLSEYIDSCITDTDQGQENKPE